MYKKMAALLLAVALLCGCAAQVTVQRIPGRAAEGRKPRCHADAGTDAHLYRGAKKIRQRVPIE